jgi:hypothetical protein
MFYHKTIYFNVADQKIIILVWVIWFNSVIFSYVTDIKNIILTLNSKIGIVDYRNMKINIKYIKSTTYFDFTIVNINIRKCSEYLCTKTLLICYNVANNVANEGINEYFSKNKV